MLRENTLPVLTNVKRLVVAQTWREVNAVNDAIREQLKPVKLSGGTTLTAFQRWMD